MSLPKYRHQTSIFNNSVNKDGCGSRGFSNQSELEIEKRSDLEFKIRNHIKIVVVFIEDSLPLLP